jgi:short/branched chain acyl-CoA dehydrogenase
MLVLRRLGVAAGRAAKSVGPSCCSFSTILSEDERFIQELAQKFSTEVIGPRVRDMDDRAYMAPEVISGLFETGLMGIEVPPELGGSGLGFVGACLAVEEVAKVDPAVAVLMDIQNTLVNNVIKFWGTQAQQEKYFPLLTGGACASFCLSESGSGSDAFSLSTRATPSSDGSHFVVDGQKQWISNAEQAEVFLVFANANPEVGYRGITCFIAEKGFGGIEVGPKEDKLGIRASSTCPVTFNHCSIPVENVVGDVGKGYKIAIEILNEGRIGIAAQMVGLSEGCLQSVMPYLFERKQFGRRIGDFQAMEHQYSQVATEIEAARALLYSTARLKESGAPFVKEAAMSKLLASQVAERTTSKCIEWLGGVGFTKAFLAEKYFRDCKIGSIYEGTSNIQLSTIAKAMKAELGV